MTRRRDPDHNVAGASQASRVWSDGLSAHVKRGILTSFDPVSYTANVLILEATNTFLQGVPLSYHMDGTSALVNNLCAVLFFDAQNYTDAVILATYPGAGVGAPVYPPGRVTFVPVFTLLNAVTIPAGNTNTYTVTGSNNIPIGALGVLVHAYFSSASALGPYVTIFQHNGTNNGVAIGNLYTANGSCNGGGMVQLSSDGKIDVKAHQQDCDITFHIYGYII